MGVDLPGPRGTLRPLLAFNADPVGCLRRWHAEFGDVVGLRIASIQLVSLRGADDVAAVLLDRQQAFVKDAFTRGLSRVLGQGLLTSEGAHWRGRRKLIAPTLRRSHIRHYAEVFVAHARRWVERVEGEVDLHHEMMGLTLGIVAEALFAAEQAADVDRVGALVEQIMAAHIQTERSWQMVLPAWLPLSPKWRIDRAAAGVTALIDRLIAERRSRPPGDDLLWRLLEARGEGGHALDAEGLRDESATLFLAGHETTALALTFAVELLGRHPDAMGRLRAEVAALGDRLPTADDMPALAWTAAVVKEAMRLYPPAWVIGRESVKPVAIGEHTLPAGATVLVPIDAMHRDPARFPDPGVFRPERWLDGAPRGRWDYLPFGGGARVCVGNHFALMEAVLVLATMVRGARFELLRPTPPRLMASITLRPVDGLPVRVTRTPAGAAGCE